MSNITPTPLKVAVLPGAAPPVTVTVTTGTVLVSTSPAPTWTHFHSTVLETVGTEVGSYA